MKTKESGIYKIVCTASGKCYVGSSKNLAFRWWEHRNRLRKGRHHNKRLQAEFTTLGELAFLFELIEPCASDISLEEIRARERHWISTLRSFDPNFGYNMSDTGTGTSGYKHSEEHKASVSERQKGRWNGPPNPGKTKAFISPSGELVSITNLRKFCRDQSLSYGRMVALSLYVDQAIVYKGWRNPLSVGS